MRERPQPVEQITFPAGERMKTADYLRHEREFMQGLKQFALAAPEASARRTMHLNEIETIHNLKATLNATLLPEGQDT